MLVLGVKKSKDLLCLFVFVLGSIFYSYAQELPKANTLKKDTKIPAETTLPSGFPNTNTDRKKLIDISLETPNVIQFVPDIKYGDRGKELEKKLKSRTHESQVNFDFRGNQFLGDIKSNGKFVNILCRDHEYVDGDMIRVLVNDKVVKPQIMLQGKFYSFNVPLEPGFNKIDFEALNQGTSGPNTAEFHVFDDQGNLISSKRWLLATGYKATVVVVKEATSSN